MIIYSEGALVFKEPIKSIPMAVSAIVLLKLGVYAVSTSQGSTLQENVLKINDTVERNENENGISRSRNDVNNEKIETQIGTQREVEGQVDYSGSKDDVNCGNEESKNGVRPGVIDCENGFTVQNNPMNSMRNSKIVDGSVEEVKEERIFHVQVPVRTTNMSVDLDVRAERSLYSEDDRIKKEINDNSEEHSLKENSFTSSSFAYLLCFAVGLCDGALLVPFKLTTYENNGNNGITEVFQYLASFGISSIIVSPILFLFYIFILNKQTVPQFHFHRAFTPGLTSGVLWASANFLSVHATYYLGEY